MTAREQAAALYSDRTTFLADERRYLIAGWMHCSATAYVLAHRVELDWPIERMRLDRSSGGPCWFVFLAAGDLGEIVNAMAAQCPLKWVAFERHNHPHLMETHRIPHVRRFFQQKGDSATGAVSRRTAANEHVPNAVYEAAAGGHGAESAGAVSGSACNSDSR